MRRALPWLGWVAAFAVSVGWVVHAEKTQERREGAHVSAPAVGIELLRRADESRPEVTDTTRVLSINGEPVEEPRGDGRAVWVIRVFDGKHTTVYYAESVLRR